MQLSVSDKKKFQAVGLSNETLFLQCDLCRRNTLVLKCNTGDCLFSSTLQANIVNCLVPRFPPRTFLLLLISFSTCQDYTVHWLKMNERECNVALPISNECILHYTHFYWVQINQSIKQIKINNQNDPEYLLLEQLGH